MRSRRGLSSTELFYAVGSVLSSGSLPQTPGREVCKREGPQSSEDWPLAGSPEDRACVACPKPTPGPRAWPLAACVPSAAVDWGLVLCSYLLSPPAAQLVTK